MSSQINELLNIQDNAEKIRDRIAAILKLELTKQKQLADDSAEIENKKDFDIRVYLENSRPWEVSVNSADANPFPLVNVCLQETNEDTSPGSTLNNVKYTGIYYIDCYGCGNNQSESPEEFIPDDFLSTIRAWQTTRIVRNILMSGFYAYLGMRGIVRRRRISKIVTIIPNGMPDTALDVTACRITFEVDFFETSPEAQGVDFEGLSFKSENDGEVTLIDI